MPVSVSHLDHFVLTVASISKTQKFYERVLGMTPITFGEGRVALCFAGQKINLHETGNEFEPKATKPMPGSADFCLITHTPLEDCIDHITQCGVKIINGPIQRTGARGPIQSIYIRDPDANLIEISNYIEA
ncbi:MAG: VOC family protein [Pseudomonadota bacterium]